MLNKLLFKIFGLFDLVKDFIVHWGIRILVVLFICVIVHNVLKMSEISSRYQGQYKKLVPVYEEEDKFMNVYQVGEGSKTIVILAGFGSQSPVIQYKTLIDGLKDEYKVVVVEYFGYGYSMSMWKHPRTNENIAHEIKTTLEVAEISGPYVLMPHSLSNVYAMHFQQKYPELVQAIVSLDGTFPKELNEEYYQTKLKENISNINITSIFELTGYERVLSYVSPEVFYINTMKSMTDVYGDEEIKVYRNRIGSQYLSRTMVREINKAEDNINEMKEYVYPDFLPVLQILSKQTVDEYNAVKEAGDATINLNELAEGMITNPVIQKVEVLEGDHMIHLTNAKDIVTSIKNFLYSI